MKKFKEIIDSFQDEMIQSLQECIKIPSVSDKQQETQKALEFYLNLAQKMGFQTKNINNLGGNN